MEALAQLVVSFVYQQKGCERGHADLENKTAKEAGEMLSASRSVLRDVQLLHKPTTHAYIP